MGVFSSLRNPKFLLTSFGLAACMVLYGEGLSISRHVAVDTFAIMATNSSPLSGGITIIAAFVVTALFSRRLIELAASQATLVLLAVTNIGGLALMFGNVLGVHDSAVLSTAGGLTLGASSTFLLVCWADYLIPFGARRSSLHLAVAFFAIAIFDFASAILPDVVFVVVAMVLAAFSSYILNRARNVWKVGHVEREIGEYRGVVPVWLSFSSIVLYAILMGGIQADGPAMVEGTLVFSLVADFAADFGMLGATLLVLLGLRFLNGNNMSYYRLIILAFISVSLYLSSFLASGWASVATIVMTMVRMLVFVYVWTLFSTPAKTMSPIRLFSVGWLLFLVPNVIATRVGQEALMNVSWWMVFGIGLSFVLLALFVLEFTPLFFNRYRGEGEEKRRQSNAIIGNDAFIARIHQMVEDCGLTPREQEVFVALARGRSAQYIADTFVVSKETARTHIRHVYQKLDVHSREELMDLVERGW